MMISGKHTLKSRSLSQISAGEPPPSLPPSPNHNQNVSPNRHLNKPKSSFRNTGLLRGVWPSSSPHSSKPHNPPITTTTAAATVTMLADYLGNDRKRDSVGSSFLRKQRSCSEFNRFDSNPTKENNLKENHKPIIGGGSMRYTGKFRFLGKSSTSLSSSSDGNMEELVITLGRLSMDENELPRRSYSIRSVSFSDESNCCDMGSPFIREKDSPASYMASTISSRKSTSNSPTKSTIKNAMKKTNALSLHSKWGSSTGRPESPPVTPNSPFSSSKPPSSPSRTAKRNILHMGLDLIKIKKNGSGCLSPLGVGMVMVENVHQLRMMHGRLVQWRYANARANVVDENLDNKAKIASLHSWKSVANLQQSVLQKRLQIQKEKLEMKLNSIFRSQMKMLEAWRDIEKRHTSAVSTTKDCLEAIACRLPFIEVAKMDPEAITIALRQGTDLMDSFISMATFLVPMTSEMAIVFTELAKVAIEEKSLLEECFEHFRIISTLEVEEMSLRCCIMEMTLFEDQTTIHSR